MKNFTEQIHAIFPAVLEPEGAVRSVEQSPGIERKNESETHSFTNLDSEFFVNADLDSARLRRVIENIKESRKSAVSENTIKSKIDHKNRSLGEVLEGIKSHRRLGHASVGLLRKMKNKCDILKKIDVGDEIMNCKVCKLSKMERKPCKEIRVKSEKPPLYRAHHTDVMGPIKWRQTST